MKNHPMVSVIMPCYNVELYLRECVQSVMAQTLQPIEIIIINDGSTDNSLGVVYELANADKRIVVINKENGGYGSAVNAGLKIATGKYISIVETDDCIKKNMLETLVFKAEKNAADIARGSFQYMRNGKTVGHEITLCHDKDVFNIEDFPEFLVAVPAIWSAIYRKSFLDENNLRIIETKGASYQDVDFFVRTALLAKRIYCSKKSFYLYTIDNLGSSSNSIKKVTAIFENYKFTDSFVYALKNTREIDFRFYELRKICDLEWHYNRIENCSRKIFLSKAKDVLSAIDTQSLKPLTTVRQNLFLMFVIKNNIASKFAFSAYGFFKKIKKKSALLINWSASLYRRICFFSRKQRNESPNYP